MDLQNSSILLKTSEILSQSSLTSKSYGGKADGLVFLQKNGFRVPEFFVIDHFTIEALISEKDDYTSLVENWIQKNDIQADTLWAVRSSAGVEDGKEKSFAGLFTSVLNCSLHEIPDAISKVVSGFSSVFAMEYHGDDNFEVNVLIQRMIPSEVSGIAFSRNPMDKNDLSVLLTVLPGLGSKLVSGEEAAMSILLSEKKNKLTSIEENYHGEIFKEGYEPVTMSKTELFSGVEPLFSEFYSGLKKLEKLKGFPVDTELCIFKNEVYWLQVRPITTILEVKEYSVWDNSNISSNYPGLIMPITSSFVNHAYSNAYISMCRFLGGGKNFIEVNLPLFKSMSGTIQGALYYNVTSWQKLAYQLPFGKSISKLLTKMWGADEATFEKPKQKLKMFAYLRFIANLFGAFVFFGFHKRRYLKKFEEHVAAFDPKSLEKMDHAALNKQLLSLEKNLGDKWFVPMINGMFTMLFFNYLKKIISKSRLKDAYPNFVNDILFGSGDVISVIIVRDLQNLLQVLHGNDRVKSFFLSNEPSEILLWLKENHPEIHEQIETYISKYGERCEEGELKIETVNYKEDPLKFISFLKSSLMLPPNQNSKQDLFDFKGIIKENYRYNPFKKLLLRALVKITINRVRDRENFRFIRTRTFGMVRQIFRSIDKELLRTGKITASGDSQYLFYDEIMKVELAGSYSQIISNRKKEYETYRSVEHSIRYHQVDDQFIPVSNEDLKSDGLKGTGCCSGIVEGKVLFVDSSSIHDLDVEGKILVAQFFEPGWIGLFARSGGLISERGSLLSHTAILCRELGIPSIIGAKGVMSNLKEGEKIRMNGATGIIEKLEVHEEI